MDSPPSPSSRSAASYLSRRPLLEYDAGDVLDLFDFLGFQAHTEIVEHAGLDGEALAYSGHDELRELGFTSIGHRLRILRAVYDLKIRDGMTVDGDEWRPPSTQNSLQTPTQPIYIKPGSTSSSSSGGSLYSYSPNNSVSASIDYDDKVQAMELELRDTKSELESLHLLVSNIAQASIETNSMLRSMKGAGRNAIVKPTLSVDVERAEAKSRPESLTPTASMPTGLVIPNTALPSSVPTSTDKKRSYFEEHRMVESPPLSPYESPTPKSANVHQFKKNSLLQDCSAESSGGRTPTALKSVSEESPSHTKRPPLNRAATSKSSAHDTCLQVLPAAVKKYNLKHPWSEYAMIVAYNSQKLALSFDERPRTVVHKLREEGETVSCLVQHQSELKSPLALAASRKAKLFKLHVASEGHSSTGTIPAQVLPNIVSQGKTLSDDIRERLPPAPRFALCIYPFQAESESDPDPEFGECFLIKAKTDKYMEVQSSGDGSESPKYLRLPHSVLIECYTQPPFRPGSRIMDPNFVSGWYITAYALVDRVSTVQGEVQVWKGDKVRAYARCSHWSFVIKERANEFGWLPSWLLSSSNTTASQKSDMVVYSPKRM